MFVNKIGTLARLYRHPVKAMRGERLSSCQVDAFGLYGDRSHYFLDMANQGKYLSADKVPTLIGYSARFQGEEQGDAYPQVRVTSPEGTEYTWGDERLLAEMEQLANRPVAPMQSTPQEGGKNWEGHILIVTQSSLQEIARQMGTEALDERRFRPNLVIALDDDEPFAEDRWLGKQLRINDVVLQINKHCERCMYVNIDPETLELNSAVLKTVFKRHDNRFGVYASVVQTGLVTAGDEVYLL
jgi:uncharacterized protein YcbX